LCGLYHHPSLAEGDWRLSFSIMKNSRAF
jgi:hypothetical protein